MIRAIAAAGLCLLMLTQSGSAQERQSLGYGRLVTNDIFGDFKDRWRTGSVVSSRVWGPQWSGSLPEGFGDLIELRLGGQIIAPDSLAFPHPDDRPYAGSLSVGLHTHFSRAAIEYSVGADLVVTGPQTRLDDLQNALHDVFDFDRAEPATRAAQIENGFHPTLVLEAAHTIQVSSNLALRPFAEARWGDETMVRIGGDLTFGGLGQGELLVRDGVTGQRYRVIQQPFSGYAFVLGADIAHVADSVYLPEDRGYDLVEARHRIRAGVHYEGRKGSVFWGLTYLGEEFEAQTEGQIVGSVRLNFDF